MKRSLTIIMIITAALCLCLLGGCGDKKSEVSSADLVVTGPEVSDDDLELYEAWQEASVGLTGVWEHGDAVLELTETENEGYWDAVMSDGGEQVFSACLYWGMYDDPVISYADDSVSAGARIIYIRISLDGDAMQLTYVSGDPLLDFTAGEEVSFSRSK